MRSDQIRCDKMLKKSSNHSEQSSYSVESNRLNRNKVKIQTETKSTAFFSFYSVFISFCFVHSHKSSYI